MAARAAISSPLLDLSIEGAKGVLFNITGGSDLTMFEVDEAARIISNSADADANIIFGAVIKEDLVDQIKITVVATGFDETRARIAQIAQQKKIAPMQGVISEPLEKGEEEKPKEESEEYPSEEKDIFGQKFEFPTFLRKIT